MSLTPSCSDCHQHVQLKTTWQLKHSISLYASYVFPYITDDVLSIFSLFLPFAETTKKRTLAELVTLPVEKSCCFKCPNLISTQYCAMHHKVSNRKLKTDYELTSVKTISNIKQMKATFIVLDLASTLLATEASQFSYNIQGKRFTFSNMKVLPCSALRHASKPPILS